MRRTIFPVALTVLAATAAAQKPSGTDVNKANNPLTPAITINFQDQGQPLLYDLDQSANSILLPGVLPYKLFGLSQIIRYTLAVSTVPNGTGGTATGLGDLNLFDLALFPLPKAKMALGVAGSSPSTALPKRSPAPVNGRPDSPV
jgi:hypothetical protein